MITIDEAIAHAREVAGERRVLATKLEAVDNINMCIKYAEEHEQLAEWLEELKILRENANGYNKEDIELNRKAMYNKAIDDVGKALLNEIYSQNIKMDYIRRWN